MGENNTVEPLGEAMAAASMLVDCYDPTVGEQRDLADYQPDDVHNESDEELRKDRLLETPPLMCDMHSANASSHCGDSDASLGHFLVTNEGEGAGGSASVDQAVAAAGCSTQKAAEADTEQACSDDETIDVVDVDFAPVEVDMAEQYISPIQRGQTFYGTVLQMPSDEGEFWMSVTKESGEVTTAYTLDQIGYLCEHGIGALNKVTLAAVPIGGSIAVAHCRSDSVLLRAMFHCDTVDGRMRYSVDYVDEGRTETADDLACLPGVFHKTSTLLVLKTSAVKCKMVQSPCKINISNMDSTTRDGWQLTQHAYYWDRAKQNEVIELYVQSVDGLTHYVMPVMHSANEILR